MTQDDENVMSMTNTTIDVLVENDAIVSTIAAFLAARKRMQFLVKEIMAEEEEIKNNKTGISNDKKILKAEMAEIGFEIAGSVKAYADEVNNMELYSAMDTTESKLKKLRDEQFGPAISNIIKAATANLVAAKDHGLEQADLDELTDLMDVWDGKKQQPRKAIINRKTSNQAQDEHLDELLNLLNNRCDFYANKLKRKHPDFYNKYTSARKIINLGTRHDKDDNNDNTK